MVPARVAAIEKRVKSQPPLVRLQYSPCGHETHETEREALGAFGLVDQITARGREDAIHPEQDDYLYKIWD
jgi:hypothetical protein